MFVPYRAKNPPESFPYVTVCLIVLNTLIYALTSEFFLSIRDSVVESYAVSHNTFTFPRLVSAMFLHGDPMHLLGNMLFLWIFGAAVEGRLRPLKFAALYLLAGFAGSLLHDVVSGVLAPKQFGLGASGAIMGLAGAYLYMFPFSTICIFVLNRWHQGVIEWQAQWVILMYIGLDLLQGLFTRGLGLSGGVAHFAHLGGFALGFAGVLALRAKRDSEYYSEAQAVRSDARGDYSLLAYHELESLMEHPNDNAPLIMAYCHKALRNNVGADHERCLATLNRHSRVLIEQANPDSLARLVLGLPSDSAPLPLVFYLRLGSRLETDGSYDMATLLYRRVYEIDPNAPDSETALYRAARLTEQTSPDTKQAAAFYTEMLRRFPNGSLCDQARAALQRLGVAAAPPALVFSAGNAAPAPAAPFAPVIDSSAPTPSSAPVASAPPVPEDDDLRPVGGSGFHNSPAPAASANAPLARAHDSTPPDDDLMPIGSHR